MKLKRPSPVLIYTSSRFLLFAACVLVLYLAGARTLLLFVLAFLVSGLLSYVLLGDQRNQMAARVTGPASRMGARATRMRTAIDERTSAEDELDDRLRAQSAPDPDPDLDPTPDP